MSELDLDSFEKSIQSNIKNIKPKSKQRGYAKGLVKKLYLTIESALKKGCSYEQIAEAISERQVKISPVTLKQYHQSNKKMNKSYSEQPTDLGNTRSNELQSSDESKLSSKINTVNTSGRNSSNKLYVSSPSEPKKSVHVSTIPQVLTGSSLTDEDYLEDFNNY